MSDAPSQPKPHPKRIHRIGILALLVVLVVAGTVFDDPSDDRAPVRIPDQVDVAQVGAATYGKPSRTRRNRSMPVAGRPGAASVTWFCGGGPVRGTTLVLTNWASEMRQVRITATASGGKTTTRQVDVAAYSSQNVPADFVGDEGTLAATIEARHGGVAATQRVTGEGSVTTAACATSSSESWFFAGGDTQRGATETLALFNPFDELATADVTFLTADGFRRPQATQGLAVPGRSVVLVDVGDVQDRRSDLGAAVTTRAGRVVAWRHQRFDGSGPDLAGGAAPEGVSVALGMPVPLERFTLPGVVTGEGVAPRIVIANPGAEPSTVQLHFAVDDPDENGQPSDTTIELFSGAVEVIEGDALRQVASGVPFSVSGRVVSGGAVVAEVVFDGAEPAKGHGSFAASAFGLATTSWVSPVGLELPVIDQLGVQTVDKAARVELWFLADGKKQRVDPDGGTFTAPASGRVTIDLAALLEGHPGATLFVTASEPVVISRLQTGPNEQGLVTTPAIPVAGTFVDP